jgi:hypothetical protein
MSAFKDTTGRSIREKSGVGKGVSQAGVDCTERRPKVVNFAINEDRRRVTIPRDKATIVEMQLFAAFLVLVIGKTGPALRPRRCHGTESDTELFAGRVTTISLVSFRRYTVYNRSTYRI